MFIRAYHTKNKKTGAVYTSHKLVESFQTERGPRQRIVMTIGTLSLPKSEWKKLAFALEQRLAGQQPLWEEESEIAAVAGTIMQNHDFHQKKVRQKEERRQNRDLVNLDILSFAPRKSHCYRRQEMA